MRDKKVTTCSICRQTPVGEDWPRRVCRRCDAMALNDVAATARGRGDGYAGDNPVFIDGRACWRYYSEGTWVTMLDVDNCRDFEQFCDRNRLAIQS